MKKVLMACVIVSSFSVLASSPQRIICSDDQRLENGPLREIILSSDGKGYFAQSSYIPSLNSPDVQLERLAESLTCRIDDKMTLAFCQNASGATVQLKERREIFYDSLAIDAKKKTNKYIDISVYEKGAEKKALSFAASHCQSYGGEVFALN